MYRRKLRLSKFGNASARETFYSRHEKKKSKIDLRNTENELIRVYDLRATIRLKFVVELWVKVFGERNYQFSHSFPLSWKLTLCFVKYKRGK